MKISLFAALTWLTAAFAFSPAVAADFGGKSMEQPAIAADPDWGPGWMVRLRGIGVLPDADANNVTANGAPLGANVDIDNSVVPELDLTYFFSPNFAARIDSRGYASRYRRYRCSGRFHR